MSKFKVGDKVKIVSFPQNHYIGKTGEVTEVYGVYRAFDYMVSIEGVDRAALEPELELVSEFSVGDRVKTVDGLGEVKEVHDTWLSVKVDGNKASGYYGFSGGIELVKEEKVSLKVGDTVSVKGVITDFYNDDKYTSGIYVQVEGDRRFFFKTDSVEFVSRPEPEIPLKTFVKDSHGCEFVAVVRRGSKYWIRISTPDGHDNDTYSHAFDSYAGKALTKIARESL